MGFEDRLAHKLYRRYSKDEAVAFLKGKLDEAQKEIAHWKTLAGKLEEARSKLGHEKKQERKEFRETEAGKRLAYLNKEVREQRNRHKEWRDKYFDLANTVARGDIELAKAKAKRLITPTESDHTPEPASTASWWSELLRDIGIYIKKTVNPKKK